MVDGAGLSSADVLRHVTSATFPALLGLRFLKLADGRGWVFETKDRLLVMSEVRCPAKGHSCTGKSQNFI